MKASASPLREHRFTAMNTEVRLLLVGADPQRAVTALRRLFASNEERFSRFRATSELSALNRAQGHPFRASPQLYRIVAAALAYRVETGGLFDPTLLSALEAAGYDRSFERLGRGQSSAPNRRQVASALSSGPGKDRALPQLDPATGHIFLPPGTSIDLGGIGKGWTVDQACASLRKEFSTFLIDAGGDLYAAGAGPDGTGWLIGVADPFAEERALVLLRVHDRAIATSAITRRRWFARGEEQHHLIDPRTGRPVDNTLAAVTVVGRDVTTAEVYAKAILIAGDAQGPALAAQRPDCAALLVTKDRRLIWCNGMERYRGEG